MKVGRLFEEALKQAHLTLKPGIEMKVRVRGTGDQLQLVVQPYLNSEFESSILERVKKYSAADLKPYHPKMAVGERIRTLRKSGGMTLDFIASKAGMTKGSLCSIEKGERSVGLAVLRKISKALGVSISALLD